MKARKSHIPPTTAGRLGGLNVSLRKQDDGSSSAHLTRIFADQIMGKYGFWRQDYFGRLSLVFRESIGSDYEERDDGSANWRQMVEQLQAQLAALKHSGVKHIVTRTETVHQLERLIHNYSSMAGLTGKKQAMVRLEPSTAVSKSLQRSTMVVARGPQNAVSNASTTFVNRRSTRLDQPQAAGQSQALEQRQEPSEGRTPVQRQLTTPDQAPAQQKEMRNEEPSRLAHQQKLNESLRGNGSDQGQQQQQAAEVVQDHFTNEKLVIPSDKSSEQRIGQVMEHVPIVPIKDSVTNGPALSLPANPSLGSTKTQGVVKWISANSKQRSTSTLQSIGLILHKNGLNQGSTIPPRLQTMTSPIGYLQRRNTMAATSPMVWRTNVGETGSTNSFKARGQQLQRQQEATDQTSSVSIGKIIVNQARRDKENNKSNIQWQHDYMFPPGHRQAAPFRLPITADARPSERIRQNRDMQQPYSSVNQSRRTAEVFKTSLTHSLNRVERNHSFFDHDNLAGERWIGEPLRHNGRMSSRNAITQMETPSSRLTHTVNLISRLSASNKLAIEQPISWNRGMYKQYPITKAIPQSGRRTLLQFENGTDHIGRPSAGITATYRALSVQRRRKTPEQIMIERGHEVRPKLNSTSGIIQLSPVHVRQGQIARGLDYRTRTTDAAPKSGRQVGHHQQMYKPFDVHNQWSEHQLPSHLPPLSLMLNKPWQPMVIDNMQESKLNVITRLTNKPLTAPSSLLTNVRQPIAQDHRSISQQNSGASVAEAAKKAHKSAKASTIKAQSAAMVDGTDTFSGITGEVRRTASGFNARLVESALKPPTLTAYGKHWIGADHRHIQQRHDGNFTEQMKTGYGSRRGQAVQHRFEPVSEIQSVSKAARSGEFVQKAVVQLNHVSTASQQRKSTPTESISSHSGNRTSGIPVTGQPITSQALAGNRTEAQFGSANPFILPATLQRRAKQLGAMSKEPFQTAKPGLRGSLETPSESDKAGYFNQTAQAQRKSNGRTAVTSAPNEWIQHWLPTTQSSLSDLVKVKAQIGYAFKSGLSSQSEEPIALKRTARSEGSVHRQMPVDRSNMGVIGLEKPTISKRDMFAATGGEPGKTSKSIARLVSGSMTGSMVISGISGSVPGLISRSFSKSFSSDSPLLHAFLPNSVLTGEAGASIRRNQFTKTNSIFAQAPLLSRGLASTVTNEIRSSKAPSVAINDFHIIKSDKPAIRSYITQDAAGTISSVVRRAATREGKANFVDRFRALHPLQQSLAEFVGNRSMMPHLDKIAASDVLSEIRGRSQDSPMSKPTRSEPRSLSTIRQSMGPWSVRSESTGISKIWNISTGSARGSEGSSLQMSTQRSSLQGQEAAAFQRPALQRAAKEQPYDHAAEVFQRTSRLSNELQRRLPLAPRTVTASPIQKDNDVPTADRVHFGGALQWQQEVRSDLRIADQALQRTNNSRTDRPTSTAEQNGTKPAFEELMGRSAIVRSRVGSSARNSSHAVFEQPLAIGMLRKAAAPPAPELLLRKSGTAETMNQPGQGTEGRSPMVKTNSSPQLSLKRISQVMPQATYSKLMPQTGSRSKDRWDTDNSQKLAIQFPSKPRSLAQAPTSVRPHKWEDTADHSGQHRLSNSGMVTAPADIFTYSQQQSTAPGLPGAQLEHKLQTAEVGQSEELQPPILELLRRQRQPEPEETVETIQSLEPLELTKEQINDLIKQIPQLDVNHLVDKVTRELEKRMRFERQRRGR
ncbi:hypothetical protein SAMN03159341_11442 [Paenibacillus sp. 1_12]|uniref:hypothetical protein n=1 Tax=Paenibacillus sp. 1_12 TaxID=1566278 RepID=UPI0008E51C09|nr:hypothetical protein [Paenibacillus sp. 1_12]SFM02002.1 hypothetical protein SAMN03159341_11442 [Paenibacillus sp. 1_12]